MLKIACPAADQGRRPPFWIRFDSDKPSQTWIGDWWEEWGFACLASDPHRLTQSHSGSHATAGLAYACSDPCSRTQIYSDSLIPTQIHSVSPRSTQYHSDLLCLAQIHQIHSDFLKFIQIHIDSLRPTLTTLINPEGKREMLILPGTKGKGKGAGQPFYP